LTLFQEFQSFSQHFLSFHLRIPLLLLARENENISIPIEELQLNGRSEQIQRYRCAALCALVRVVSSGNIEAAELGARIFCIVNSFRFNWRFHANRDSTAKASCIASAVWGIGRTRGRRHACRAIIPSAAAHYSIWALCLIHRIALGRPLIEILVVEILTPFPDVAVHIIQVPGIGWEAAYRRSPFPLIHFPYPTVVRIIVANHVSDRVPGFCSCAARAFPFGLGRQTFSPPATVCVCIVPAYLHDRMIHNMLGTARRALGMSPVGALLFSPPFIPYPSLASFLCISDIVGTVNKFLELRVCCLMRVYPEAIQQDLMLGMLVFFALPVRTSHLKCCPGYEDHRLSMCHTFPLAIDQRTCRSKAP